MRKEVCIDECSKFYPERDERNSYDSKSQTLHAYFVPLEQRKSVCTSELWQGMFRYSQGTLLIRNEKERHARVFHRYF